MLLKLLLYTLLPVIAADDYFTGDGTAYTLGAVPYGNCNFMRSGYPNAATNYVAMNQEQWNGQLACGRCAEVSCADPRCSDQSKTAIVQVLDRCPECKYGDLDMSPIIFKQLTGSDPSRYKIKWRFVDCPIVDGIYYCLHAGSSNGWISVQPTGLVSGIKSMSINGMSATMMDGAFYFIADPTLTINLNKVVITLTDIDGYYITETISLSAGQCSASAYICD